MYPPTRIHQSLTTIQCDITSTHKHSNTPGIVNSPKEQQGLFRMCRFIIALSFFFSGLAHCRARIAGALSSIQHPYFAKRDVYFVSLLRMALERSGEAYKLINVDFSEYSERRSVLLLQSNQYDVHWMNTTAEREQELLPVRIPLCKGLSAGAPFLFARVIRHVLIRSITSMTCARSFCAGPRLGRFGYSAKKWFW